MLMLRIFVLALVLVGCDRKAEMIGVAQTHYEMVCLHREYQHYTHYSYHSGHVHSSETSQCVMRGCDKVVKKLGKYAWDDETLIRERVPMSECEMHL